MQECTKIVNYYLAYLRDKLSIVFIFPFLVFLGYSQDSNHEQFSAIIQGLLRQRRFEQAYTLLELRIQRETRPSIEWIQYLFHCLRELRKIADIDSWRTSLVERFPHFPELFMFLAQDLLNDPYHWGTVENQIFYRGRASPGIQVTSWARDRWQALYWLYQAYLIINQNINLGTDNQVNLGKLALLFARSLTWYQGQELFPQPLLEKTDFSTPPDWEPSFILRFARPSLVEFLPKLPTSLLFFSTPASLESAQHDGERLMFLLQLAKKHGYGDPADELFADLYAHLFSLKPWYSFSSIIDYLRNHSLQDNQILRIINQQLHLEELPATWNFITIYRRLERWEKLAQVYEDRQQYQQALLLWNKLDSPIAKKASENLQAPSLQLVSSSIQTIAYPLTIHVQTNAVESYQLTIYHFWPEEFFTIVTGQMREGKLSTSFFEYPQWIDQLSTILEPFTLTRKPEHQQSVVVPVGNRLFFKNQHSIPVEHTGIYYVRLTSTSPENFHLLASQVIIYFDTIIFLRDMNGQYTLFFLNPHTLQLLVNHPFQLWKWEIEKSLLSEAKVTQLVISQTGSYSLSTHELFEIAQKNFLLIFVPSHRGGSFLFLPNLQKSSVSPLSPPPPQAWLYPRYNWVLGGGSLRCIGSLLPFIEKEKFSILSLSNLDGEKIYETRLNTKEFPIFSRNLPIPSTLSQPLSCILSLFPGNANAQISILPFHIPRILLTLSRHWNGYRLWALPWFPFPLSSHPISFTFRFKKNSIQNPKREDVTVFEEKYNLHSAIAIDLVHEHVQNAKSLEVICSSLDKTVLAYAQWTFEEPVDRFHQQDYPQDQLSLFLETDPQNKSSNFCVIQDQLIPLDKAKEIIARSVWKEDVSSVEVFKLHLLQNQNTIFYQLFLVNRSLNIHRLFAQIQIRPQSLPFSPSLNQELYILIYDYHQKRLHPSWIFLEFYPTDATFVCPLSEKEAFTSVVHTFFPLRSHSFPIWTANLPLIYQIQKDPLPYSVPESTNAYQLWEQSGLRPHEMELPPWQNQPLPFPLWQWYSDQPVTQTVIPIPSSLCGKRYLIKLWIISDSFSSVTLHQQILLVPSTSSHEELPSITLFPGEKVWITFPIPEKVSQHSDPSWIKGTLKLPQSYHVEKGSLSFLASNIPFQKNTLAWLISSHHPTQSAAKIEMEWQDEKKHLLTFHRSIIMDSPFQAFSVSSLWNPSLLSSAIHFVNPNSIRCYFSESIVDQIYLLLLHQLAPHPNFSVIDRTFQKIIVTLLLDNLSKRYKVRFPIKNFGTSFQEQSEQISLFLAGLSDYSSYIPLLSILKQTLLFDGKQHKLLNKILNKAYQQNWSTFRSFTSFQSLSLQNLSTILEDSWHFPEQITHLLAQRAESLKKDYSQFPYHFYPSIVWVLLQQGRGDIAHKILLELRQKIPFSSVERLSPQDYLTVARTLYILSHLQIYPEWAYNLLSFLCYHAPKWTQELNFTNQIQILFILTHYVIHHPSPLWIGYTPSFIVASIFYPNRSFWFLPRIHSIMLEDFKRLYLSKKGFNLSLIKLKETYSLSYSTKDSSPSILSKCGNYHAKIQIPPQSVFPSFIPPKESPRVYPWLVIENNFLRPVTNSFWIYLPKCHAYQYETRMQSVWVQLIPINISTNFPPIQSLPIHWESKEGGWIFIPIIQPIQKMFLAIPIQNVLEGEFFLPPLPIRMYQSQVTLLLPTHHLQISLANDGHIWIPLNNSRLDFLKQGFPRRFFLPSLTYQLPHHQVW